jgi:hypothetical protein
VEKRIIWLDSKLDQINRYWEKGELIIPLIVILVGILLQLSFIILVIASLAIFLEIYSSQVGKYEKELSHPAQKIKSIVYAFRIGLVFFFLQIFFDWFSVILTKLFEIISDPSFFHFNDSAGDTADIVQESTFTLPNFDLNGIYILIVLLALGLYLFPLERLLINRLGEYFRQSVDSKQMRGIISDWAFLMALLGDFFFLFSYVIYYTLKKLFRDRFPSSKSLSSYILEKIETFPKDERRIAGLGILLILGGFFLTPFSLDPLNFFMEDVFLSIEIIFWYFFLFICLIFSVKTQKHFFNFIFTYIVAITIALRSVMILFNGFSRDALIYISLPGVELFAVLVAIILVYFLYCLLITAVAACCAQGLIELRIILTENLTWRVVRTPIYYGILIFVLACLAWFFIFDSIDSLLIPVLSSYYSRIPELAEIASLLFTVIGYAAIPFVIAVSVQQMLWIQEVCSDDQRPKVIKCPKCKKIAKDYASYCEFCGCYLKPGNE